jgi:hypothetical protein
MKLLTFGCPQCNSEALMHMQFRRRLAHAFAVAGSYALKPHLIRCDGCRRKITAADAGIDYRAMMGVDNDWRLVG